MRRAVLFLLACELAVVVAFEVSARQSPGFVLFQVYPESAVFVQNALVAGGLLLPVAYGYALIRLRRTGQMRILLETVALLSLLVASSAVGLIAFHVRPWTFPDARLRLVLGMVPPLLLAALVGVATAGTTAPWRQVQTQVVTTRAPVRTRRASLLLAATVAGGDVLGILIILVALWLALTFLWTPEPSPALVWLVIRLLELGPLIAVMVPIVLVSVDATRWLHGVSRASSTREETLRV